MLPCQSTAGTPRRGQRQIGASSTQPDHLRDKALNLVHRHLPHISLVLLCVRVSLPLMIIPILTIPVTLLGQFLVSPDDANFSPTTLCCTSAGPSVYCSFA